jgi:hypothetical protein
VPEQGDVAVAGNADEHVGEEARLTESYRAGAEHCHRAYVGVTVPSM